jgi:hypothetical protein
VALGFLLLEITEFVSNVTIKKSEIKHQALLRVTA